MTFWHWICDNTLFKSVTSQLSDIADSKDPRIDVNQFVDFCGSFTDMLYGVVEKIEQLFSDAACVSGIKFKPCTFPSDLAEYVTWEVINDILRKKCFVKTSSAVCSLCVLPQYDVLDTPPSRKQWETPVILEHILRTSHVHSTFITNNSPSNYINYMVVG